MTQKEKLLQKARKNPQNLRFEEFQTLLEQKGFILSRITGSHHQYFYPKTR